MRGLAGARVRFAALATAAWLAAACRGRGEAARQAVRGDSAGAESAAAATPAGTAPAATPTVIRATCASLDSMLRAVVAARPERGLVRPTAVTGPDTATFSYQWARATGTGCRSLARGADSAAPTGAFAAMQEALRANGWIAADSLYSADGPDGSLEGFVKGDALCLLEGSWDGGDDSDSTYVPSPDFEVRVTCAARRADDHPPR
jgi:hypothetical protein